MLKAYYRSSLTALVAGVVCFAASIVAMRVFHLSERVVLAPGVFLQSVLNGLGADLPNRMAVLGTLLAWCLVADAVFLFINRPWQRAEESRA